MSTRLETELESIADFHVAVLQAAAKSIHSSAHYLHSMTSGIDIVEDVESGMLHQYFTVACDPDLGAIITVDLTACTLSLMSTGAREIVRPLPMDTCTRLFDAWLEITFYAG